MIIAVPLRQDHLDQLYNTVQPSQKDFVEMMARTPGFIDEMKSAGPCRAIVDGDKVLCCAGLMVFPRTGRCVIWCAYAADLSRKFIGVFRVGIACLQAQEWRRVEAQIDPTFKAARRLARMAGFEYEGTMRKFFSDGTDREMWARTR